MGWPTHPQADRGSLRLDQEGRRPGTHQVSRPGARRMGLHLRSRRLQSCSAAEASGGLGLKAPANCRLIGRWRIVESDLWDRAHLDLSGPATLTITAQGGEIAFGALEGGLEVDRFPLGRMREKAMRSRAKEPPNCSTTGRSRSNSPTETATKPSSKQNKTLLQQPARSPRYLNEQSAARAARSRSARRRCQFL